MVKIFSQKNTFEKPINIKHLNILPPSSSWYYSCFLIVQTKYASQGCKLTNSSRESNMKNVPEKYKLKPQAHTENVKLYDEYFGYKKLLEVSQNQFQGTSPDPQTNLKETQFTLLDFTLNQDALSFAIKHFEELQTSPYSEATQNFIKLLIHPEMDRELKAYFKSHYALLWYQMNEVDPTNAAEDYSKKWHCDGGPTSHLKTITYLEGSDQHGSTTDVMDVKTSTRLKEIGYAFCDISHRQENIEDLCQHYGLQPKITKQKFKAGQTCLFNPFYPMHKAGLPKPDKTRRDISLCFIPSPIPWEQAIELGFKPDNSCCAFKDKAFELLNLFNSIAGKTTVDFSRNKNIESSHTEPSSDQSYKEPPMITNEPAINLHHTGIIDSKESLLFHCLEIFKDQEYAETLSERLLENFGGNLPELTVNQLILILKSSFQQNLKWDDFFPLIERQRLIQLLTFEQNTYDSLVAFAQETKPNPDGIMWPIPTHEKYPRSKYKQKPYVRKFPIMDKSTPIGSAGSCFAFEIAKVFQQEAFNYVITERADHIENGVIVDTYTPGDKYALFSANYGILFNTPSLLQLAQKAFGERHFQKLISSLPSGLIMDPYRENVFFRNKESYLKDYPKHIRAVRESLLQSEVFIYTAGLNECWQVSDGTVISRNPRHGFNHLIQHRVLSVQENVDYIKGFYKLVKKHNPNFKLILTLSPIPLLATGRGDTHHIIEANTHSKAVLRVALDQAVSELEDCYYLPSYELVMECTEKAWEDDHRHVRREVVAQVVDLFKEMFVKEN